MRELRQAAGWTLRELGARANVSHSYLGKMELDQVSDPTAPTALAIDRALSAGGRLAGLACQAPVSDALDVIGDVDPDPSRPLGEADVISMRDRIWQLVGLDREAGGDELYRVGLKVLGPARAKLAAGRYATQHEADLRAVVAELSQVTAWLAYDADEQSVARRLLDDGVLGAELAGEERLAWFVRDQRCLQSQHLGRPSEALAMADRALADPHTRGRMASISLIRRARALAALGSTEALPLLDRARSELAQGMGSADSPWTAWMHTPEQDLHAALAHSALGLHRQAADLAIRAINGLPAAQVRDGAVYRAYLVQILTVAGAWEDAIEVLAEMRTRCAQVGSTRMANLVVASATRPGTPQPVAEAARAALAVR
ncbi:helix-turn-helix transcriptional regulator [Plantactinospora sp. S1510]|uniref:Helix-turn-helix transcriptional regulator n=2 Tax=Plantactinospora alkalitolerans TaxID=2789879 RepID=A0ABS0H9T6_9ACTN|nr:helix-turn-helix transcriptional regulator [Plantactinospora alkalitolerans]